MRDLVRIPLPAAGWTVHAADRLPLEVPPFSQASIHSVLERAGVQRPWTAERAELDSEWVGRTEWTFRIELEVPPSGAGTHCALAIDTIDGPCEVVLGGVSLGMHRSEHFPFDARVPGGLGPRVGALRGLERGAAGRHRHHARRSLRAHGADVAAALRRDHPTGRPGAV